MRSFGTLIVCLIGVAVVYGVYWFVRAVTAANDAHAYVNETWGIADALKLVWTTQSLPDGVGLTAAQSKYVERNEARFLAECEPDVARASLKILRRMQEESGPRQDRIDNRQMQQNAIVFATLAVAKEWCAQRGVA